MSVYSALRPARRPHAHATAAPQGICAAGLCAKPRERAAAARKRERQRLVKGTRPAPIARGAGAGQPRLGGAMRSGESRERLLLLC